MFKRIKNLSDLELAVEYANCDKAYLYAKFIFCIICCAIVSFLLLEFSGLLKWFILGVFIGQLIGSGIRITEYNYMKYELSKRNLRVILEIKSILHLYHLNNNQEDEVNIDEFNM